MTLRENYQHCGRAFARKGWPASQVTAVLRGVNDDRLADIAMKAFTQERADRPFDAELPEGLV